MADSESPFVRERNLSNRNFKKRTSTHSRRRISAETHSSMHSEDAALNMNVTIPMTPDDPALLDVKQKVQHFETLQADESIIFKTGKYQAKPSSSYVPVYTTTPRDNQPVRVLPLLLLPPPPSRFKRADDDKGGGESGDGGGAEGAEEDNADGNVALAARRGRSLTPNALRTDSIVEEGDNGHATKIPENVSNTLIYDDVDVFDDDDDDDDETQAMPEADEFVLPEVGEELLEGITPTLQPGDCDVPYVDAINLNVPELGLEDFERVGQVRSSTSSTISAPPVLKRRSKGRAKANRDSINSTISCMEMQRSDSMQQSQVPFVKQQSLVTNEQAKDFTRNYRSTQRPQTEYLSNNAGPKNRNEIGKFSSFCYPQDNVIEDVEYDEAELRNKSDQYVQPILDELIKTEETYVANLWNGIENYGNIFTRKDVPVGLRGKKYVLLGNIEQLAEFHRDEFLPMLKHYRYDLKQLFDKFQLFIEENCFYGYVIFTMNKQRSLKLCDVHKNYFKLIQTQLDDKLGINSFLVQPIQRMARYPLLLNQFITTLFKYRDCVSKQLIESCCRLEKKLRVLLTTTNESEVVNDIVDCTDCNVFFQGKFRKVSEFSVADHTLKRSYRCKIFIFDKCIIYTEIKGKNLIFHGRYPCESVGIVAKQKSFILFYQQRKQQECEFYGDPGLIENWLELIRDMTSAFVQEEREKLKELYGRDHVHRKASLSLYRDSNRFSSDSGIGNIWVMPKPEATDDVPARTTWYTTA